MGQKREERGTILSTRQTYQPGLWGSCLAWGFPETELNVVEECPVA